MRPESLVPAVPGPLLAGPVPRTRHLPPLAATVLAALALAAALPLTSPAQAAPGAGPAPRITEQTSGTTQLIQAVHAVSARVVWASGHGGVVLRTRDGGSTWQRVPAPGGDTLEFRDVHAASADSA